MKFSALSEAGHEYSVQELMTNTSVERLLPLADDLPVREGLSDLQPDNFHVVLVPLRAFANGHRISPLESDTGRVFVLPLTWKELMLKLGTSGNFSKHFNHDVVRFGDVTIDLVSMEVCRSKRPVILTAMEFKVLRHLVANPNRVISRNDLLDQVWGYDNYPCTRTVDNHILRLRQKLEPDFANPVHFITVYGMGYKFIP